MTPVRMALGALSTVVILALACSDSTSPPTAATVVSPVLATTAIDDRPDAGARGNPDGHAEPDSGAVPRPYLGCAEAGHSSPDLRAGASRRRDLDHSDRRAQ